MAFLLQIISTSSLIIAIAAQIAAPTGSPGTTSEDISELQNSLVHVHQETQNINQKSKEFFSSVLALELSSEGRFTFQPLQKGPMFLTIPNFSNATQTPYLHLADMYLVNLALQKIKNVTLLLHIDHNLQDVQQLRHDVASALASLLSWTSDHRLAKYQKSLQFIVNTKDDADNKKAIRTVAKAVARARTLVDSQERLKDVNAIFGSILATSKSGDYVNIRIKKDMKSVEQSWATIPDKYQFVKVEEGDFILNPSPKMSDSIRTLLDEIQIQNINNLSQINTEFLKTLQDIILETVVTSNLTTSFNALTDQEEPDFEQVLQVYEMLRKSVGIKDWAEKQTFLEMFDYFRFIAAKAKTGGSDRVTSFNKSAVNQLRKVVDDGKSNTCNVLSQLTKDVLKHINTQVNGQVRNTQLTFKDSAKNYDQLQDAVKRLGDVLAHEYQSPTKSVILVAGISKSWKNSTDLANKLLQALKRYQVLEAAKPSAQSHRSNSLNLTMSSDLREYHNLFSNALTLSRQKLVDQAVLKLELGHEVKTIVENLDRPSLRAALAKLSNFTSKTLYTELVVELPSSADDLIVIRNYFDRVISVSDPPPSVLQGLEFDAALQIASQNADKDVKQQLKPLAKFTLATRSRLTSSLAELIRSGNPTKDDIPETFKFHGPEIITKAYDRNVNNTDPILKFAAKTNILQKSEDRLLAYKTLFEEMSKAGHFVTEHFLHFVFQVKKFHNELAKTNLTSVQQGLQDLISKVPRNVRELVFYGDSDSYNCVIISKVYGLAMKGYKYAYVEKCPSDSCPSTFFWRFRTADDGKTFYILNGRQHMSLGRYNSENFATASSCTCLDGKTTSAKIQTVSGPKPFAVEIDQRPRTSEDLWKIKPVEDARYLHFETLISKLPGGLLYPERHNGGADQEMKLRILTSRPERYNTVSTEALMEIKCSPVN